MRISDWSSDVCSSDLVFDEVTSQLDPASTEEIYRLIGTVFGNSPDRTVLFIDHKLDALLPMIDRVVLLDDGGQVVADAPPAEMFHDRYPDVAVTGAWRDRKSVV